MPTNKIELLRGELIAERRDDAALSGAIRAALLSFERMQIIPHSIGGDLLIDALPAAVREAGAVVASLRAERDALRAALDKTRASVVLALGDLGRLNNQIHVEDLNALCRVLKHALAEKDPVTK